MSESSGNRNLCIMEGGQMQWLILTLGATFFFVKNYSLLANLVIFPWRKWKYNQPGMHLRVTDVKRYHSWLFGALKWYFPFLAKFVTGASCWVHIYQTLRSTLCWQYVSIFVSLFKKCNAREYIMYITLGAIFCRNSELIRFYIREWSFLLDSYTYSWPRKPKQPVRGIKTAVWNC